MNVQIEKFIEDGIEKVKVPKLKFNFETGELFISKYYIYYKCTKCNHFSDYHFCFEKKICLLCLFGRK
jgi:hypothetical protein